MCHRNHKVQKLSSGAFSAYRHEPKMMCGSGTLGTLHLVLQYFVQNKGLQKFGKCTLEPFLTLHTSKVPHYFGAFSTVNISRIFSMYKKAKSIVLEPACSWGQADGEFLPASPPVLCSAEIGIRTSLRQKQAKSLLFFAQSFSLRKTLTLN